MTNGEAAVSFGEAEAPSASSSLAVVGDEGPNATAEIRVDGAEETDAVSSLLIHDDEVSFDEAGLADASSAFRVVEAEVARLASELPRVGSTLPTSSPC